MRRTASIWLFDVVALCVIVACAAASWLILDVARPVEIGGTAAASPSGIVPPAPSASSAVASVNPSLGPNASLVTGNGTWTVSSALPLNLWGAGAAVLHNGRVLAVGGTTGPSSTAATTATELFDPATGHWTSGQPMLQARAYPATVTLRDGSVLVAGGARNLAPLDSAERYYPDTGTWIAAGRMSARRVHATATLLHDGRVLVAGGATQGTPVYAATASAEIYDPKTGAWTPAGNMAVARVLHVAALLPSGEVLVAGGANRYATSLGTPYASAEIYDPRGNSWRAAASMSVERYAAVAATTETGHVLVAGGWFDLAAKSPSVASAEEYDPTADRWVAVGPMTDGRAQARMISLADGRILIAGGVSPKSATVASGDLFDPRTRKWTPTGPLPAAVIWPVLVALPDGRALIAGGALDPTAKSATAASAIYAPPPRGQ